MRFKLTNTYERALKVIIDIEIFCRNKGIGLFYCCFNTKKVVGEDRNVFCIYLKLLLRVMSLITIYVCICFMCVIHILACQSEHISKVRARKGLYKTFFSE